MARADHHNEIEINFLTSDWVTYLLAGRSVTVQAGELFVFWAAIPHQIIAFGGRAEYYVATIPLPWFLQCQLPATAFQQIFKGQPLVDGTGADKKIDALLFERWVKDLEKNDPQSQRAAFLEIEARLLRLSRHAITDDAGQIRVPDSTAEPSGGRLTPIERMTCYIAQHYREKLTVDDVARAANLHPNYAMTLFQKTLHSTIVDYLAHHRLNHAQRLLVSTNRKIVDIAFDSGFHSMSRFNEAFRKLCACTPREFRKQNRDASRP